MRIVKNSQTRRDILRKTLGAGTLGVTMATAGCTGNEDGDPPDDVPAGNDEDPSGNGDDESRPGNGDNDSSGNDSNSDDGWERANTWKYNYEDAAWRDMQYNPFNPTNSGVQYEFTPGNLLFDQVYHYSVPTDTLYLDGCLADDIYVDDGDLVVEHSEGRTWHNGDEVTARHEYLYAKLSYYMGLDATNIYESVDAIQLEDDYTLRLGLVEDQWTLDTVVALGPFHETGGTPPALFDEWLERFEEADGDDEIEEIRAELLEFAPDEPIGNGPFEFVDVDETRIRYEKFEDHPSADLINFDSFEQHQYSDGVQALSEGLVHHSRRTQFPAEQSVMELMPEDLDTETLGNGENALRRMMINYDLYPTDDVRVRQAIAHLLDSKDMEEFTAPWIIEYDGPSTALGYIIGQELAERVDFITYDGGEEAATELMQEAGFEQEDGQWVDDDGPLEIRITRHLEDEDLFLAGDMLEEFGFEASTEVLDLSTYVDQRANGDMHMTPAPTAELHPISAADSNIANPGEWEAGFIAEEVEIPMPIGDQDGDMETVNISEVFKGLTTAEDDDEYWEHLELMAWIGNWHCTLYHHARMVEYEGYRTRWWEAEVEDQGVYMVNGTLLRWGGVRARDEPPS